METGKKSSKSKISNKASESEKKPNKGSGESDANKVKKSKSKEALDSKVIRLLGNRSVYHVFAADFVRVSQLMKHQQTAGNLMSSADLHRFSDQSIMALVAYVETREIKSALTYYAITELITLANTFQMNELKAALEDCIISAATSSEADLLQTLIICDVTHLTQDTEKALQALAVDQIDKLVSLPDFHKMPFHQLYQVMSSCEMQVTHEMFIADVVLFWLVGQEHVNNFLPALLSCIRTKFLSPVDRTLIMERINQLNMPTKSIRLARNMLESANSQRVCADSTHVKKNWPRCGANVSPAHFNPHSSLPLSRPSFNMKMKKTKEAKNRLDVWEQATAPKVIDLISKVPKSGEKKSEKSGKSGNSEGSGNSVTPKLDAKKEIKIVKKPAPPKTTTSAKKSKKSRCACIQYVKDKMNKKSQVGPAFKDPKALKIRPPGVSSKNSTTKDTTSKISSKMSSNSSKTSMNSNRSENQLESRRGRKREKIQKAIRTSKDKSEKSASSKGSSKGSKKSVMC